MKNFIRIFFISTILIFGLESCGKDSKNSATAKVKVEQNGLPKSGVTVYMFGNRKGPDSSFFTPFHADKQSVTENDGIAIFELKETFDLELINDQTTLYFGVFEGDVVLGRSAVTIKKGETKTVNINL